MGLPPVLFIGVGLLVSGISLYMGEKLIVFAYVGLAFIVWGAFKLVARYLLKKPTKKEEKQTERRINQTPVIACPYCATSCYSTARFCHMCGATLVKS